MIVEVSVYFDNVETNSNFSSFAEQDLQLPANIVIQDASQAMNPFCDLASDRRPYVRTRGSRNGERNKDASFFLIVVDCTHRLVDQRTTRTRTRRGTQPADRERTIGHQTTETGDVDHVACAQHVDTSAPRSSNRATGLPLPSASLRVPRMQSVRDQ